jgi:hypothetical protein
MLLAREPWEAPCNLEREASRHEAGSNLGGVRLAGWMSGCNEGMTRTRSATRSPLHTTVQSQS